MKKNKILYISYDGLTDQVSSSQIIPYLKVLSEIFLVNVITCEKKNKYKKYSNLKNELYKESNINCNSIYFTPKKYSLFLSKFFDFFKLFMLTSFIIKTKKIKIVHCRGHIPAFLILVLKKLFNVQLIFDYRGMWIEERIDLKAIDLSKTKGKLTNYILKKFEKHTILISHKIIVLTLQMKKYICAEYNYDEKNIFVIPCYVNTNLFNPKSIADFNLKKILNINSESKILCYLGSIGGIYLIEEMLNFFKQLRTKNNKYYFLFITKHKKELKEILNKKYRNILEYVKILELEYEDIPKYLKQVNVCICFKKNSIARLGTFSIKFAEALSLGIPQIYNTRIGDFDKIFLNNEIGTTIDIENNKNINNVIENFNYLENLDKKNIRECALNNFSIKKANTDYIKIYKNLY